MCVFHLFVMYIYLHVFFLVCACVCLCVCVLYLNNGRDAGLKEMFIYRDMILCSVAVNVVHPDSF